MENDKLLTAAHEDLVRQRVEIILKTKVMKDLYSDLSKLGLKSPLAKVFKTAEEWVGEIIKYIKEQPYNV